MASKALTPQQNQRARELVRELIDARYEGKKSAAAPALGVSQPLLTEVLGGTKGVGGKLLMGLSRLAPESVAKILGQDPRLPIAPEVVLSVAEPLPPSYGALPRAAREEAIALLADGGYSFEGIRAALAGVGAYEAERPPRELEITPLQTAKLAKGLLDQDLPADGAKPSRMERARGRIRRQAEQLAKGTDRVRKRRAGK